MPRIHILTNPNPTTETKANFFADWFHYFTSNIGSSFEFELENPLSLIDKIIYQFEYNPKHNLPYITNYFSHHYLNDVKYLEEYDSYKNFKVSIQNFNNLNKKGKRNFIENPPQDFTDSLKAFKEELDQRMFRISLSAIISYLKCPHELSVHLDAIKSHTQILVTEYLFRGKDKNDLTSIFFKILSKDVNEFPFPKEITNVDEKHKHIKNRGLEEQFNGLFNLLEQSPKQITYFLKIYGAEFDKGLSFKYNEVTIYSKDHSMFDEVKKEAFGNFFFKEEIFLIASVSINFFSSEIGLQEARDKIKKELNFFSTKFNRDLIVDETPNYLIEVEGNFKILWSTDQAVKKYDDEVLEDLEDNPYIFLAGINSNAKKHFLDFEYLLLSAIREKSISGYWHYLETLLQANKQDDELQQKLSTILLLDESALRKRLALNNLFSLIDYHSLPVNKFPLSWQDTLDIQKEIIKKKLPQKVREIDYPIINHLVSTYDTDILKQEYKEAQLYYERVLKEAYAQRNFYIHKAISNEKSNLKLKHSLPTIIQRFRWIIFDEIKLHENLEFNELIDLLYEKGKQLLT